MLSDTIPSRPTEKSGCLAVQEPLGDEAVRQLSLRTLSLVRNSSLPPISVPIILQVGLLCTLYAKAEPSIASDFPMCEYA